MAGPWFPDPPATRRLPSWRGVAVAPALWNGVLTSLRNRFPTVRRVLWEVQAWPAPSWIRTEIS